MRAHCARRRPCVHSQLPRHDGHPSVRRHQGPCPISVSFPSDPGAQTKIQVRSEDRYHGFLRT
ncbi:hypothetical protein FIBSPDRAFT_877229, partial [Athelia psychrophila]